MQRSSWILRTLEIDEIITERGLEDHDVYLNNGRKRYISQELTNRLENSPFLKLMAAMMKF